MLSHENYFKDKVQSREDYEKTINFLKKEMEFDEHNCREMLNIEPSHLTKGKITAMGKLGGQYKKASKSLIKQYESNEKEKDRTKRYNTFARKRTWLK